MDFDRCLSTSSNSRYYDPWYPSSYNPPSTMQHQHGGYSMRDQHDYPSPAPSDPSPGPRSLDLYASSSSADSMVGPFSQIESSIGPARSTRHRSSISRQGSHTRRLSLLSGGLRDQDSLQSPSHLQETLLPRTDSPTLDRFEDRSPMLHSTSPTLYQPNTPVSVPSPFSHSHYDQARRSRTRSMDKGGHGDHDFRAHSPALSTHSGQTSSSSRQGHLHAHAMDSSMNHVDSRGSADVGVRPKKKERHHKHKLRDQDRKAICVYHLEHPNARQEDIGSAFGVERSTISKILKDKDRWLNISDDDPGNETSGKHRPSKFPEVEFEMVKSLQLWADRGENITDQLIRQRALEIAKGFGMPPEKFKGSSGWIENFKHRHDIRRGEWLKAGNRSVSGNNSSMNSNGALGGSMNQSSPTLSPYDHQHHRNASSSESSANSSGLVIDPALQQPGSPPSLLSHLHHSSHQPHSPHSLAPIQHSPTMNTLPTISHHSQSLSSLPSLPSQHSPLTAHPSSSMQVQYGVSFGAPLSPLLSRHPPPPTLAEAENAINIVLDFLDRGDQQNEPVAKEDEREVLTRLKVAMFQRASGIAFER